MRRSLLAGLLVMVTIFTAAVVGGAGLTMSWMAAKPFRPVPAQQPCSQARTRVQLTKEVRHELLMLPYYSLFDWLQFEIQPDGTVILEGQVTRPNLKSDAEQALKKLEGVKQVVNQIEVLPLSPNDDRIRRAVYRALFDFDSPLFRYALGAVLSIHIIVKRGNVTLKGVVDTKADIDLANIKAHGVPGVFDVKNELSLEAR